VFVPLLALACYRVGRRTQSPPAPAAGLLAVVFALGTPLLICPLRKPRIYGP
jgi:hypothetical protein